MSRSWSSAHDWKSCKGQKLFESSNLSISAMSSRTVYSPRYFLNSLLIHPVAPPFQHKPAALGFDLVFGARLNAAASVPMRCCIKILCLFSWLQHNLLFFCFQPRPTRATARVARFFRLPHGSNVWTVGDAGPCAGAKNTLSS